MNMLIETRNSYAAKLEEMKVARNKSIEEKVNAYRLQVEAATPTTEIDKLQDVISSLDKVINYEASESTSSVSTPAPAVNTGANVDTSHVVGRQGMAGVFTPERR